MRCIYGLVLSFVWAIAALAQGSEIPIIPGAHGFGMNTPAGSGRHLEQVSTNVIEVTNLFDSGEGSLRDCVLNPNPRVCIFEVSGVIELQSDLEIFAPYLTIAGQTAPSPGITLRGRGLSLIATHDILIQHIRVRVGEDHPVFEDDEDGEKLRRYLDNHRAFNVQTFNGEINNIVIDHCSFGWSIDQIGNVVSDVPGEPWDNVTLNNNIFSEPLHDNIHPGDEPEDPPEAHGFGPLIDGNPAGKISMIGNLFAHSTSRNPAIQQAESFFFANNLIYNFVFKGTQLSNHSGPTDSVMIGNVYIAGLDDIGAPPIEIGQLISGSSTYVADTIGPSGVSLINGDTGSLVQNPPFPMPGFVPRPSGEIQSAINSNVGARPSDRDEVDDRIVSSVQSGTGHYINCVANGPDPRCVAPRNAGGWPNTGENERNLTPLLPTNPNGDDDEDGYTNLEEWLHGYSAQVEGGGSPPSSTVFSDVDIYLGDRDNWTELTLARWELTNDGSVRYTINTSAYNAPSGSGLGEYSLINDRTYGDFHFTALAKSTDDLVANPGADFNVVFGYQDAGNYYYAMFNRNSGLSELFKVIDGQRQSIATASQSAFTDNEYHTIEVIRSGSTITAYIDSTELMSGTDSTFGTGRIGIGSFNDGASFDDVVIDTGSSPPGQSVVEAEDMQLSDGYAVESGYGRIYIPDLQSPIGRATATFAGPAGTYDIHIHVVGESDGEPLIEVNRGGDYLGFYYFLPGAEAFPESPASHQIFTITDVALAPDDIILIRGYPDEEANARIDKIVFEPD